MRHQQHAPRPVAAYVRTCNRRSHQFSRRRPARRISIPLSHTTRSAEASSRPPTRRAAARDPRHGMHLKARATASGPHRRQRRKNSRSIRLPGDGCTAAEPRDGGQLHWGVQLRSPRRRSRPGCGMCRSSRSVVRSARRPPGHDRALLQSSTSSTCSGATDPGRDRGAHPGAAATPEVGPVGVPAANRIRRLRYPGSCTIAAYNPTETLSRNTYPLTVPTSASRDRRPSPASCVPAPRCRHSNPWRNGSGSRRHDDERDVVLDRHRSHRAHRAAPTGRHQGPCAAPHRHRASGPAPRSGSTSQTSTHRRLPGGGSIAGSARESRVGAPSAGGRRGSHRPCRGPRGLGHPGPPHGLCGFARETARHSNRERPPRTLPRTCTAAEISRMPATSA